MTATASEKAARALTTAKCTGDKWWFPRIFIVGESVYFFRHSAEMAQKCAPTCEIEEMTFEEAYISRYGRKVPSRDLERINRQIEQ